MTEVIRIFGASIFDTSFSTNDPSLPEVTWNVTYLERDAYRGCFDDPVELPMNQLPEMDLIHYTNLDREKVHRFVRDAKLPITPNQRGMDLYSCPLIDLPIIRVYLPWQGAVHAIIVDGNHRMAARALLKKKTFWSFEVPVELEKDYRVTIVRS